jgi:hypothetical protein
MLGISEPATSQITAAILPEKREKRGQNYFLEMLVGPSIAY